MASSWILFFSYQDGPMHIKLVNNCSEYLLILFYPTSFWSVFMTLTKAGLLACFENSNSIYIWRKKGKSGRICHNKKYTFCTLEYLVYLPQCQMTLLWDDTTNKTKGKCFYPNLRWPLKNKHLLQRKLILLLISYI